MPLDGASRALVANDDIVLDTFGGGESAGLAAMVCDGHIDTMTLMGGGLHLVIQSLLVSARVSRQAVWMH